MDPNIICEHSGFSEDGTPRPGEDGASYLRRLKGQPGDNLPAAAAGAVDVKERRQSPRFQCCGSVEVQPRDGDAHMWGALKDISLHGCYVEMPTTFPTDTLVTLKVEVLGIRFLTQAKVRVTYPSLGMGMCFTEVKPEQQSQLKQVLMAIAGDRATTTVPTAASPRPVVTGDPKIFVDKLTEHFKKNSFLSRDEFSAIAKRVCRP